MGCYEIDEFDEFDTPGSGCRCGYCCRRRDEARSPAPSTPRKHLRDGCGCPSSRARVQSTPPLPPPFDRHLDAAVAEVLGADLGASEVCAWGGRVRVNFGNGPTIRVWPAAGSDGVQKWRGESEHYLRPHVYSFPHACDTVVDCVVENALTFMGRGPDGIWRAPWLPR